MKENLLKKRLFLKGGRGEVWNGGLTGGDLLRNSVVTFSRIIAFGGEKNT